jgi:hypothetical protein
MTRTEKIDAAICVAGELVRILLDLGPLNSEQVGIIIDGNVRAAVPDAREYEIIARARVIAADLSAAQSIPKIGIPRSRKRRSVAPNSSPHESLK